MTLASLRLAVGEYARAQLYAVSSIRRLSDLHLMWGPAYARLALGLGARNFSLYSLAAVPKHTWRDYLVNEPLKEKYAAITSKDARALADDKVQFYEHCTRHGIATANILTVIAAARTAGNSVPHAYSTRELEEILAPGEYFIKPSNGSHGVGAFSLVVGVSGLKWAGRNGSFEDFFQYCVAALKHARALIVQPKLSNHHEIRNFTRAKGLSTIRVVTVRKSGNIVVIGACMRIIVGESEVDNFSHGAGGNLVAAVDVDNGQLVTARGSRSRHWPEMMHVNEHPSSGTPIVGLTLPHWPQMIELVKKAHNSIASLHTVGWDVAITDAGPVIVEANWRYDIDILQVGYMKGYRQVIQESLGF